MVTKHCANLDCVCQLEIGQAGCLLHQHAFALCALRNIERQTLEYQWCINKFYLQGEELNIKVVCICSKSLYCLLAHLFVL